MKEVESNMMRNNPEAGNIWHLGLFMFCVNEEIDIPLPQVYHLKIASEGNQ
ncbi:hypothetical protein NV379_04205 [Paenibacillus sp. N1-5-1-14]|nr:hypothetical protein [Paenibacillus radicibacter]